jgi:AhpD family alkylhydroperoxidase
VTLRVDYTRHQREIYRAMLGVHDAVAAAGLERSIIELVNIRASQINGCAYCLSLHIPDALEAGVSRQQVDLISAWRECGDLYSPRERAALAWTEQNTLIAASAHDDEVWAMVREAFGEDGALALTWAVAAINTWNRVAVPMRRPIIRREVATPAD